MTHFRISSEFEGVKIIDDDGTQHTAQAVPFYVQTRLSKWQPICIKHKLIFKSRPAYDEHWTPVCDTYNYQECPPSDLKKHLKGYSKG
jgi:hypothetical protein